MPEALRELSVHELARGLGEVADEGRTAALIVHHRDLLALRAEAEHRPKEVVAGRTEQPRGPDHPRSMCPPLPRRAASSVRMPTAGFGLSDSTYGERLRPSKT